MNDNDEKICGTCRQHGRKGFGDGITEPDWSCENLDYDNEPCGEWEGKNENETMHS